jgi:TonB family protein
MKLVYYFAVSAAAHTAMLSFPLVTPETETEVIVPVQIIVGEKQPNTEKLSFATRQKHSGITLEKETKLLDTQTISHPSWTEKEPSSGRPPAPEAAAPTPAALVQPPKIEHVEKISEPSAPPVKSNAGSIGVVTPSSTPPEVGRDPTPLRYAPAGYAHNPIPEYPEQARRQGWEGIVLLGVLINRAGSPERIEIKKSSGFEILDRAATRAVMGWRFHPARHGETILESWVSVPIVFRLSANEN